MKSELVYFCRKNAMTFHELISRRKSRRKFSEQTIESEKINLLINAALMSPTGKQKNHWDFVFIQDKNTLAQLANCKPHGSKLIAGAALAVVVIGDPAVSDTWIEDCSIASIYLQLQAEDLGLGSCWVQVDKREHSDSHMSDEYVRRILNIPESKRVLSIIAIGYPADEKKPFDKNELLTERIHMERF
jgi:nitroreductase